MSSNKRKLKGTVRQVKRANVDHGNSELNSHDHDVAVVQPVGDGTITVKNGAVDGHWRSKVVEGTFYHGEFKDGTLNGRGIKVVQGKVYEGEFKEGKLQGQGKITHPDGTLEEGEFKNDNFNGYGKVTASDGKVTAEGKYENGGLQQGELVWKDRIYKGTFENDNLKGPGMVIHPDGRIDEGEFENDLLHGYGKITRDGKITVEGQWEHGALQGRGYCVSKGNIYEGEFKKHKLNGQGKITYLDGRVQEGEFQDDTLHGRGKVTYPDGRVQEGEFNKLGELHGRGTVSNSKHQWTERGVFTRGKLTGGVYRDLSTTPVIHHDQDGKVLDIFDAKVAALEDKVQVLTEMVHELQNKMNTPNVGL